mmetsp:Transcript_18899/g.36540  ORF Transcript_18899/g.36540 Transcript_18899/m.36540 type:complete len:111 (+) Transcript_18899:91-423(+)
MDNCDKRGCVRSRHKSASKHEFQPSELGRYDLDRTLFFAPTLLEPPGSKLAISVVRLRNFRNGGVDKTPGTTSIWFINVPNCCCRLFGSTRNHDFGGSDGSCRRPTAFRS